MIRLSDLGHPYPDETICYPKAGHTVSLPPTLAPTTDIAITEGGILFALGGTPQDIAVAQRRQWEKTIDFFKSALGEHH